MFETRSDSAVKRYRAPWSSQLIAISGFLIVLCIGVSVITAARSSGRALWVAPIPVALAMACALFSIRGYTITPDSILVHRLLWATNLRRAGLESAQFSPGIMRWSVRTFGNGGFFSFSGFYWNKTLGSYRAYVTDPASTVVLCYSSGRTVVLSPAAPEDFVRDLGLELSRQPKFRQVKG
jgi:hypothetical protein